MHSQNRIAAICRFGILNVILLGPTPAASSANADAPTTAPTAHPLLPAFERFHASQDKLRLEAGWLLISELNCRSCHAGGSSATGVQTKPAPVLDAVGERVRPEWMLEFLANPQHSKPGTTMPDLFPGLDPKTETAQVAALVAFLATTGTVKRSAPEPQEVVRGERLFHQVGCIACHQSRRDPKTTPLTTSVPLGAIDKKYTTDSLARFLEDPLAIRPGGRMPSLGLSQQESRDIAGYFFRNLQLPPNLNFAYYEGNWSNIPDFNKLKPVNSGQVAGFQLGVAARRDQFGIRFTGFLQITRNARYTFFLGSDDGSRLTIDGKTVVEVDGIHPYQEKQASLELDAGHHPLQVDFFEAAGGEVLKVQFQGPKITRRDLSTFTTTHAKPKPAKTDPQDTPFVTNPSLVEIGRKLFASIGCASCHKMTLRRQPDSPGEPDRPIQPTGRPAGRLGTLDILKGCLSQDLARSPQAGVPDFQLSAPQRQALTLALKAPALDLPHRAELGFRIAGTLEAFNCLACHSRDKRGGVERARNDLFVTTIKEMGDEGRIPPQLDGVGDKLNDKWLKHVLDNGANDRSYMLTRMPKFGAANVGHLVKVFAAADRNHKPLELALTDRLHRVRSAGRFIAGDKALACIKCHDFGGHKATGIRSLDLLTMTRRLRKDWFVRYMLDPQTYRPGTRMPAAWPRGQTLLPEVLDGIPVHQIASVWEFLADGGKAGLPRGLIRNPIELAPTDEPIIYRNFISGLSPRGIAVGYPEKANLAFDADQMALKLIWHNAFIDAAMHWNGRGQGFQTPLGDHLVTLSGGVPFATLATTTTAWPTGTARKLGYRFTGYRIDKQRRPVFRYRFGAIEVEDHPRPVKTDRDADLVRTLTLQRSAPSHAKDKAPAALWYRAAAAPAIELQKNGTFVIDKILNVSIQQVGGQKPVLRKRGNQTELLVPVHWDGDKAVIVHRYAW
jgi:mono/diheme cytochrome c family protein